MADPVLTPRWYLQPGAWPYWLPNALAAFAAPRNDASIQNSPWPESAGGILGGLLQAARGKIGASRAPARGGILGPLTASSDNQSSSFPYWLQTGMPFGLSSGAAALPPSRPLPQPTWDSSLLSNLLALPSALSGSATPYWLRTALPPGANSESLRPPQQLEQPPSPTPLVSTATREESPAAPGLSWVADEGQPALWQELPDATAEPVAALECDLVSGPVLGNAGINPLSRDYGPQLDDTPADDRPADRSPWSASAEEFGLSDMRRTVRSDHPMGRQWSGATDAESEARVVSDVTHDDWKPGARYAARARRGSGPRPELELGQANRLVEAQTRAESLIARVREIDPKWRPRPSAYESVEGLIRAYESDAEQAQARLREVGAPLPPIIPRERAPTASERNDIARAAAQWLTRNRGQVIEGPDWFSEYEPSVRAYLDPPKTLQELQQAVSAPQPGYDIHHIVERTSAEQDGFLPSMINAPENLVRVQGSSTGRSPGGL
jgi:hypothetical protein